MKYIRKFDVHTPRKGNYIINWKYYKWFQDSVRYKYRNGLSIIYKNENEDA